MDEHDYSYIKINKAKQELEKNYDYIIRLNNHRKELFNNYLNEIDPDTKTILSTAIMQIDDDIENAFKTQDELEKNLKEAEESKFRNGYGKTEKCLGEEE